MNNFTEEELSGVRIVNGKWERIGLSEAEKMCIKKYEIMKEKAEKELEALWSQEPTVDGIKKFKEFLEQESMKRNFLWKYL